MVRIGGDASGVAKTMKTAKRATSDAKSDIKKSVEDTKKAIYGSFYTSGKSVKDYSAAIAKTRQDHRNATQGAQMLSDKISRLESVYDTVKDATKGIDLSKPLEEAIAKTKQDYRNAAEGAQLLSDKIGKLESVYEAVRNATKNIDLSESLTKQIEQAQKTWESASNDVEKYKAKLREVRETYEKKDRPQKILSMQKEFQSLVKVSAYAKAEVESLNEAAAAIGAKNIGYASSAGIEKLQKEIASARSEMHTLRTAADEAGVHLSELDRAADAVGEGNMGHASAAGLEKLQKEIASAKNEMRTMQKIADETGAKLKSIRIAPTLGRMLKSIGATAAAAASGGVKKLGSAVKSIAGSAARGLAALPGKLASIGKSAASGTGGLNKMVKSIRNIGVVSLGLRVASGMFGRLRSVISNYISNNEELNASVSAMKDQLGQALAPAINLVLKLMQQLMPVITSVSNGISAVMTAIFGKVSATTGAIKASAEEAESAADGLQTYGFDQITKASDDGSSGASSAAQQTQEQSALVRKLTGWIQELKAAFANGDWAGVGTMLGDGINKAFDELAKLDIGQKIGAVANNVITTLHSLFTTIDFTGIGASLGASFTGIVQSIDWNTVGETIGAAILALPSMLVGFILETDWAEVGTSVTECVHSAFSSLTTWIQDTDWLQIGKSLADLVANIDWAQLASDFFSFLGNALVAGISLLWGFIEDAVARIGSFFSERIDECGGDVVAGLLKGIGDALIGIGTWLYDNVVKPFLDAFDKIPQGVKDAFNGLWDFIKGIVNSIIGGVESFVNFIIDGINFLIGGFNDVAGLAKYIGIDLTISEIQPVSLKRLATGGITTGPTIAEIGEAGKEAVLPLENNTGWMDILAERVNSDSARNAAATSVVIPIYIGKRKLAEQVISDINDITRTTGTCPIYV